MNVISIGIEPPVPIESFILCETVYAYGTTIRVWYRKTYHTRMVRTVRVRYVPYAYGMKHAYGTQQYYCTKLVNAGVRRAT